MGVAMEHDPKTVAQWFISRAFREGEYLTQMKLQKLVYIAHGWNLGLYNDPLISGDVEAWQWGPVVRPLYATYAIFGSRPIVDECIINPPGLRDDQSDRLAEKVWEVYRKYTAAQLSELTHRPNTPWSQYYVPGQKRVIPNHAIATHYRELANAK